MENCQIEWFFLELNLRKWFVCCSFNPHHSFILHHLNSTGINLNLLSGNQEKYFSNGRSYFLKQYQIYQKPQYIFKILLILHACIEIILTNLCRSLKNSCIIEEVCRILMRRLSLPWKHTFKNINKKNYYHN